MRLLGALGRTCVLLLAVVSLGAVLVVTVAVSPLLLGLAVLDRLRAK